ncbi:MAG: hypothetical protein F7C32_01220 [Desulfurococcales archaeon]|nr:hypothetical protein [Desulfurococcales archaeon]
MLDKCPKCGSQHLLRDLDRGIIVCTQCGFVIEENIVYAFPLLRLTVKKHVSKRRSRKAIRRLIKEDFFLESLPHQSLLKVREKIIEINGFCTNRKKRMCQAAAYALILMEQGMSKARATAEAAGHFLVNKKKLEALVTIILKARKHGRVKS